MYQHVLVAIDGSDHSKRAAQHAIQLVEGTPLAQVTIVCAVDYGKSERESNRGLTSEQIATAAREHMAPFEDIFHQAEVRVKSVIVHGAPGPAIVSHANEHPYDIVIIGSRGLNPVQEFVLGSVSHKVAKRVKAPVLVIK
ncbi:universal stress protein [Planococcus sp. CP5-4]|uniref:universal stress protein n=1 Tax=unclassified Planococcus (in: firmicutes) TaxID=2662419 RepID=UPI001C218B07|nr:MULTISPECIES: universal stress protein [unclassified Planococcus (in: firmicutes)]MBU9672324.1 universal stress protein [Planococcus sp. CP5-4_YE]MBV0909375.1 universal stress protein [Planococcus sp. CP5-4_UN]MBW6064104.1 universal stress protein [Planococcus sp. CP5-4]